MHEHRIKAELQRAREEHRLRRRGYDVEVCVCPCEGCLHTLCWLSSAVLTNPHPNTPYSASLCTNQTGEAQRRHSCRAGPGRCADSSSMVAQGGQEGSQQEGLAHIAR